MLDILVRTVLGLLNGNGEKPLADDAGSGQLVTDALRALWTHDFRLAPTQGTQTQIAGGSATSSGSSSALVLVQAWSSATFKRGIVSNGGYYFALPAAGTDNGTGSGPTPTSLTAGGLTYTLLGTTVPGWLQAINCDANNGVYIEAGTATTSSFNLPAGQSISWPLVDVTAVRILQNTAGVAISWAVLVGSP